MTASSQKCVITGLPAGQPDACQDCDPCTDPNCWTDETWRLRRELMEALAAAYPHWFDQEDPCPYCHGDGVERAVGYENDVIEQPCSRGCPTPFQKEQAT